MLFVTLLKSKPGSTATERSPRRLEWEFPPGVEVIGEYWLQSPNPQVVLITETDSVAPMMAMTAAWDDHFEISVHPAVTAEEGLEILRQMAP
ncbi:MAG: DUF3303 family protein [Trueperaceae bacterium]|nr:MAG: DUF3303 family protein [Trueperaceae bacterium]